jgi:hypothetical protein
MLKDIGEACNILESFVLDDSATLLRVLLKHNSAELKSFSNALRESKEKEFYFSGQKYKFYNPGDVNDLINYMLLNKVDYLSLKNYPTKDAFLDKIVDSADPRKYITTACVNYDTETDAAHRPEEPLRKKEEARKKSPRSKV